MQQDAMCRGCLAVEGKFSYVHEFNTAQAYETLIGNPVLPSDEFPQQVCSFCLRTLQKFAEFRERCLRALEVLEQVQARGEPVTKGYSHYLTSNCPGLKPRYVLTKTVTLDIPGDSDNLLKQETSNDLSDFTEVSDSFGIEKEEKFSENKIEVADIPDNVLEPKQENLFLLVSQQENNENDLNLRHHAVLVDDFKNARNKVKKNARKVKKVSVKRSPKPVKTKSKVKKKCVKKKTKKASKSDTEIVTEYAKSTGFDITFLSHAEQIQEVEEKKKEVVASGHNCRQCGKHFDSVPALERHKKNYHIMKPDSFMCDICSCVFKTKRALRSHVTGHSWIFTCQSCNFKTKQRPVLRKHQYYHEGKMFTCKYCGKAFDKHASYFSHVRLLHAAELSWCDLCGDFFNSEKGVESHKKLSHNMVEEFPNACRNCDKRFKGEAALERHVVVKGCNQASCALCGESFVSSPLLRYHLVQRHFAGAAPAASVCPACGARFHNAPALWRHRCGLLACAQCGDCFASPQALTDHVDRAHYIFKCEECGKQFTNAAYFKRHYLLCHTGGPRTKPGKQEPRKNPRTLPPAVRRWRVAGEGALVAEGGAPRAAPPRAAALVCELCGKTAKNSTELRYHHQTYHTEGNLFSCSHCSKGFKRKDLLQMHERVHTGERPYQCPECPKAFKTHPACRRHQLVHSGARSHVCGLCDKAFQLSTSVKWHIRTAHLRLPWPARSRARKLAQDSS